MCHTNRIGPSCVTTFVNATAAALPESPSTPRSAAALIPPALAGGAVALALGTYGRVHDGTGERILDLGFPSLGAMKSWLATAVFALAVLQVVSALAMFGRLPGLHTNPRWVPFAHRWAGTAAFLISLPVAYHCLWSLGFETTGARQLVHGIAGCVFYGAITTKLLALRTARLPRWSIPVVGGSVFAALAALGLPSALWFFTTVDFPALP
jgi:hypothetical protein